MTVYVLIISGWKGATCSLFINRKDAEIALLKEWEDAKRNLNREPEDCYWNSSLALITTDDLEDYWYGCIEKKYLEG